MPAQVTQSVLADFDAATVQEVSAHAHDPLRSGLSDLPPGISGGVAKLVKCRFEKIGPDTTRKLANGQSAAGQAQFVIAAVVMEPAEIVHPKTGQVIRVAGQQFRPIPIPICEVKRGDKTSSRSEMAVRAMDDMKLLADNEKLFPTTVTAQILEQTALALENRSNSGKPVYFRFSTENSDDGTMVFQNVRKAYGLENYAPPSLNGQARPTGQATQATQSPPAQAAPMVDPLGAAASASVVAGQPNVQALVTLSSGDERLKEVRNAQVELMNVWKASGRSEQSFREAPTYADIGKVLLDAGTIIKQPAAPTPTQTGPKKDDVWKVKIAYTDPMGDPQTMLVDAVVTECNADGTFNLTDLKTRTKPFSNMKREDLVAV